MTNHRKNPVLRPSCDAHHAAGFSLVEVLVTIVILLIGLLGLAGLQGRALTAQMESYQRSQALILLQDMAGRIEANRAKAAEYITATPMGEGYGPCTATGVGSAADLCTWSNALLGAAETQGTNKVGAMIGARGCVYQVAAAADGVPSEYLVVVAWQGLNSTFEPDATNANSAGKCGNGKYLNRDGNTNEALHRVVSLPISIAYLK